MLVLGQVAAFAIGVLVFFFFQAEDGIRYLVRSRGLGDVYKRQPYTIALGNMFRRKGRLLLTQLVLILAGTMFLMVLTLSSSMTHTLDTELDRRQYDLRLFFFEAHRTHRPAGPLALALIHLLRWRPTNQGRTRGESEY